MCDIIATVRVMSNYKLTFTCLVCVVVLMVPGTVRAQQQDSGYTIQLLPIGENGAVVNHDGFPATEVRFLILHDGTPLDTQWPESEIVLLEDDTKVAAEYAPFKQPLDVTVVYHYTEFGDIDSEGLHNKVLDDIVANLKDDIRLRSLCLTMVSAMEPIPCRPLGSTDTPSESFISRTDYSTAEVTDTIHLVSYPLIWNTIMTERIPGRPHMVLWVLDDDILSHGSANSTLLPVDENQLARLRDDDISLIFIDLTSSNELQGDDEWKPMLQTSDVLHLKYGGVNYLSGSDCRSVWDCIREDMNPRRPMIHRLRYNSNLFVDGVQHSLRVQLQSKNRDNRSDIIAHERTDFVMAPPYQIDRVGLRPAVYFFSRLFNAIAVIVLILVLILINRPQDESI